MAHESRASGNSLTPSRIRSGGGSEVGCAAGRVQGSLLLEFIVDRPGRFIVHRGGIYIGGIEFKPGGWIAYEIRNGRPAWSPHGRIKARFAAHDMWGEVAAGKVGLLPDNRPEEKPRENGAVLRRDIERGRENEVRT